MRTTASVLVSWSASQQPRSWQTRVTFPSVTTFSPLCLFASASAIFAAFGAMCVPNVATSFFTGAATGSGVGAGFGQGYGSGVGDGTGALAPFGVPGGGGGLGPKSNFIGLGGNAKRIAYVCDASGSMLNMFDSLKVELRKSIENLRPIQSFNVVFFQDQGFKAADANTLIMGNPENKRKAYDFLDKMFVRGETDPIPALETVAKMQPELIYLLTDGDFSGPGNQAVVEYCAKQFGATKTKINTIAFVNENDKDTDFMALLQKIAKDTGGVYRFVRENDL
jgi:hypothetical protein